MLDLKKPLDLVGSPLTPYEVRARLADIPGISAVLSIPSEHEVQSLVTRFEVESGHDAEIELLREELQIQYLQDLESIDEQSDGYEYSADFHAKRADIAIGAGQIAEAMHSAERSVQRRADEGTVYRLGSLLIENDSLESASEVLASREPNSGYMEILRQAQIALMQGSVDDSERLVDRALQIEPNDYRGWMFKGTLHLSQRKWQSAIQLFRAAAEEEHSSSSLHVNLAIAYMGIGQESKALNELRRACFLNPGDNNAINLLCKSAITNHRPRFAVWPIHRHFLSGGRSRQFLERAARVFFLIGESETESKSYYEEAKKFLECLLSNDGPNEYWNNLGVVQDRLGNNVGAVRLFSKAFQLAFDQQQDVSLALSNLLVSQIRAKKYKEVLRATHDFFSMDNAFSSLHWAKIALRQAAAMEGLGEREKSAELLAGMLDSRALPATDAREILSTLVVHFSAVTEDAEKLRKYLPTLIETIQATREDLNDDSLFRLHNNIAFAYLALHDTRLAAKYLSTIREQIGTDPFATATQGLYLVHKGDVDDGKALYRHAISIATNRALKDRIRQRMHYELARHFVGQRDLEKARQEFQRSISVKLGFEYLRKDARTRLNSLT